MYEERQRSDGVATGPAPFGDEFAGGTAVAERRVDVVSGVHAHSLPLVGMTVAQVRSELAERMNIDPAAMAVVDGNPAAEDTVLAEGQTLNFVKHSGEKGATVPDEAACQDKSPPAGEVAARVRVEVIHGVHSQRADLPSGATVGDVRRAERERMNIAPAAQPVVDGVPVDEEFVLTEDQVLVFVRLSGEMGGPPADYVEGD
jgi:hypothetical protein